jgi:hypothetical protein
MRAAYLAYVMALSFISSSICQRLAAARFTATAFVGAGVNYIVLNSRHAWVIRGRWFSSPIHAPRDAPVNVLLFVPGDVAVGMTV